MTTDELIPFQYQQVVLNYRAKGIGEGTTQGMFEYDPENDIAYVYRPWAESATERVRKKLFVPEIVSIELV